MNIVLHLEVVAAVLETCTFRLTREQHAAASAPKRNEILLCFFTENKRCNSDACMHASEPPETATRQTTIILQAAYLSANSLHNTASKQLGNRVS